MNSSDKDIYIEYTEYPEYKAGIYIWKILPPILILFGTTGNILSIIVLRRPNIKKSVCSISLVVLAVSDLIVLYTGLLRQWIYMAFDLDIRKLGPAICKLHTWIVYFSLDFSSWILVAVTVERLGLVWFPYKTKARCTKRVAGTSLIIIAASLLLFNSHILYGVGDFSKDVNGTRTVTVCGYITDGYYDFWHTKWPWIDLTVFCGVPFCCLLLGNLLIFIKVLVTHRAIKRKIAPVVTCPGTTPPKNDSKLSSMSIMLFTLNTMFLLCTTPISVYLIGYPTWVVGSVGREYAIIDMMWAIVNILMYTNNSVNFLLYILSGSRFRREFKDLFREKVSNRTTTLKNDSMTRLPPMSPATCIPVNNVHHDASTAQTVITTI